MLTKVETNFIYTKPSLIKDILYLAKNNNFPYMKDLVFYLLYLRPPSYNVKYLFIDNELIGFNIFQIHGDKTDDIENIISFQYLLIDSNHRNKGYATQLLKLPYFIKNPTFRVEIKKENIYFFNKQGFKFKRISKTGNYIVMEK